MPSSDALLSSLVVTGGTLSPAFNQSIQAYSVQFPAGTDAVSIALTKDDAGAAITYHDVPITSGAPISYGVSPGQTVLSWLVTAADGSHLIYTLIITVSDVQPVPPFAAKLVVVQSDDNETLTFKDESNYTNNSDGIGKGTVTARSVQINDGAGAPVATLPMTLLGDDGFYYVNYTISKDVYYASVLSLTLPGPITKTGADNYLSIGFYNAAFQQVMENNLGDCGSCNKGKICSDVTWSQHLKNAAVLFAVRALGILAQDAIDAANSFINNVLAP